MDYIGIADNLRKSLGAYTIETTKHILSNITQIIDLMKEKYEIVSDMFYGIDYHNWKNLSPEELATLTAKAYSRISDEVKKKRFVKYYVELKKLYALASPHPETMKIKDDIKFFEMIKKMIVKYSTYRTRELSKDLEYEINQLISKSIAAEEPVDIFSIMKKDKPEISLLDDEFLAEIEKIEYKNYAADVLFKIINDQLKIRLKRNPVRYKSLYEMLIELIDKYNIRLITTSDVIEELLEIARKIKKNIEEGKRLNLTEEELAFYDLLSSKNIFENEEDVKRVAKEILNRIVELTTIADWNKKEGIRARIRAIVKEILLDMLNINIDYHQINAIANDILGQAEMLYGTG